MSDDLVKRLRAGVGMQVGEWPVIIHQAADRIEALEAALEKADDALIAAQKMIASQNAAKYGATVAASDARAFQSATTAYRAAREAKRILRAAKKG